MSNTAARVVAVLSVIGTVLAVARLPWAVYGAFDIPLHRFPLWELYVAAAAGLHLAVGWRLLRPSRAVPRLVVVALTAGTAAAAVLVASRYDDATVFFGPIVPAVAPLLGLGAPVAVLSAVVAGAAGWFAGTPVRPSDRVEPAGR